MTALRKPDDDMKAEVRVDVVEAGAKPRAGRIACGIERDLRFSTEHLESYCLAAWEPVVYDALVLCAGVEYCDRIRRRPVHHWGRSIELRVPVHDPERWNARPVNDALHATLGFLTGDRWSVSFVPRRKTFTTPKQFAFSLPSDIAAVIPFSEGLDSRAVAGLMHKTMGDQLIRVRLGTKAFEPVGPGAKQPFTSIPYKVKPLDGNFAESSVRSRGFKFAMVSGVAAYLVNAGTIIVTESGQGALGPALVPVGQTYEDYRNHPLFTDRMEALLAALYGRSIRFEFPRLWHTKGETLAAFVAACDDGHKWSDTWSCWQQNRQASVAGYKRQCGVCAACMLRRLSVHAAGLTDSPQTYVWEDLAAASFENGAAKEFGNITKAMREYAIAGALHLHHLALLRHRKASQGTVALAALQLARSRGIGEADARARLERLLSAHEAEWTRFLASLGAQSFVAQWVERR